VREIFNKEVRHEVFTKKMKNLLDSELIKERREKTFNDFLTNDKGKDLDFDKIYFLKKQNIIIREIKEQ
jgi:predicted transcriptional regulator